jgi:predicted HTH domain antitoxin
MEQHIRLMGALNMFELGKVSPGKAAQLTGMSRAEFFDACGRDKVSIFNYPHDQVKAEIKQDMENALKMRRPIFSIMNK